VSTSGCFFILKDGAVTPIAFVTKHCLTWVVADCVAVSLTGCDVVKREVVAVLARLL
jgi:hypothetical protein